MEDLEEHKAVRAYRWTPAAQRRRCHWQSAVAMLMTDMAAVSRCKRAKDGTA